MENTVFSLTKHQNGYKNENRELILQCPFKFNSAISSGDCECTKDKCALWMIQQHACAINVSARVYGYVQANNNKQ
jgi:hypothetical protein